MGENFDLSEFDSSMHEEPGHVDTQSADPVTSKNPSVHFAEVSDADLDVLKRAAKSDRTHKPTMWGVRILQGNVH